MSDLLQSRLGERSALLERVRQALAAEPTVQAAWLFGSEGRGEADAFSDLDVAVVVADEHIHSVSGGPARPMTYVNLRFSPRGRFVAQIREPLLLVEAPQNAPDGGAFLSSFYAGTAGPQGIDWVWQRQSTAQRPDESVLLLDRDGLPGQPIPDQRRPNPAPDLDPFESAVQHAASAWAMLLWAAKGVARHPQAAPLPYLFDCVYRVERFLGHSPNPVTEVGAETGAEKMQLLHEMADRMATLTPALVAARVELPPRIGAQVETYLSLVDQVIAMA